MVSTESSALGVVKSQWQLLQLTQEENNSDKTRRPESLPLAWPRIFRQYLSNGMLLSDPRKTTWEIAVLQLLCMGWKGIFGGEELQRLRPSGWCTLCLKSLDKPRRLTYAGCAGVFDTDLPTGIHWLRSCESMQSDSCTHPDICQWSCLLPRTDGRDGHCGTVVTRRLSLLLFTILDATHSVLTISRYSYLVRYR
jgi:hypothetical protein